MNMLLVFGLGILCVFVGTILFLWIICSLVISKDEK